jgi:hypothetical protein
MLRRVDRESPTKRMPPTMMLKPTKLRNSTRMLALKNERKLIVGCVSSEKKDWHKKRRQGMRRRKTARLSSLRSDFMRTG